MAKDNGGKDDGGSGKPPKGKPFPAVPALVNSYTRDTLYLATDAATETVKSELDKSSQV